MSEKRPKRRKPFPGEMGPIVAAPMGVSHPETNAEKLVRVSVEVARNSITEFHTNLIQISAAIEAGDLERARQFIGLSVAKIAGIYGIIFLEVPDWCLPSIREELAAGIASLRKQIENIKQVRQHENTEQLDREAGEPPRRAN